MWHRSPSLDRVKIEDGVLHLLIGEGRGWCTLLSELVCFRREKEAGDDAKYTCIIACKPFRNVGSLDHTVGF